MQVQARFWTEWGDRPRRSLLAFRQSEGSGDWIVADSLHSRLLCSHRSVRLLLLGFPTLVDVIVDDSSYKIISPVLVDAVAERHGNRDNDRMVRKGRTT